MRFRLEAQQKRKQREADTANSAHVTEDKIASDDEEEGGIYTTLAKKTDNRRLNVLTFTAEAMKSPANKSRKKKRTMDAETAACGAPKPTGKAVGEDLLLGDL